jgi:hypothetical protein
VCFLLRDKLYPQLSVTDIEALVPMCNVVVPPLLSYRTFGNEEVNQRTFDRLKWIDSKDAKALALLRKYITTLLIMAAARLRPSGVNAKFSAPLSFGDNQREAFSKVISQAAAEAQALTGVSFQASLTNDESRCIVIKFLESFDHRSSVPLWVVCDIGGGSVDFAVATGGAQGQGPFTSTYALLAADSIRFGADLVFRSFVKSAGREISSGTHEATIEQDVREELAKHGFDSLVERCSPRTKDHIFSVVSCYYYLIGEYLARTVAGCIRNKKRFVGLFEDKNGYGIGALEADELGVQLEVLVTGNGFRTFDVIKEGRSSQRLVEDFSGWVRDRVHALLHTRLSQWENDDVAWFDGMPQPTFKGYYGLSARGHTYLKEALAYSIVATKDLTNTTLSALDVSTPNGLNEFRRGNRMLGLKGAVRPWYAFVGSPKVVRPNLPSDQQGYVMPQDEPWFFNSADIAHDPDTFGPDFPQEVRTFATKLGWNLTLTHLFSQSAVDIRQRISHRDGIQRVNSLLKALYEIGVSRVFTQDWI